MNSKDLPTTGQVFYRMAFHLGLCGVFLIVRQGLQVLGRKTTDIKGHSHHITSKDMLPTWLITVDVDLDHGAEVAVVFVRFSAVKLLFFSLSL